MKTQRRVVILGSTGTLGKQALALVLRYPNFFSVYGLTGGTNETLLKEQAAKSGAAHVVLTEKDGMDAVCALVSNPKTDIVIHAIGGVAGIEPTWAAVHAGKTLLFANKESLVCAGRLIMAEAARTGARVIPLDSELSAIANCLRGIKPEMVRDVIITCSGGPFWHASVDVMKNATKKEVLKHPTWTMGARITVDSATLMNKGLEVIETQMLFDLPLEKIRVLVHPQSVVHGMCTLETGETRAVLAPPSMETPILAALNEVAGSVLPGRADATPKIYPSLQFEERDDARFPALPLAYDMARDGGVLPAIFCVADEIAVHDFLADRLPFSGIVPFVQAACATYQKKALPAPQTIEEILKIIHDYRSSFSSR